MLDRAVLNLLADGKFHSGESMGQALGISRAAVWKRLQIILQQGFPVERVRGKGYRLPYGLELLDAASIKPWLADNSLAVEILEQTASTNDEGMADILAGKITPRAILAEHQTHGRGRLGRRWQSPFGYNLYLTLVWPLPAGADLRGMSLVVGLALLECLQSLGLTNAGLKWPNDVLVNEEKLAGVLIELAGNLEVNPVAVIGIGVNGWLGDVAKEAITQPATDWVTLMGQPLPRNALAGQVLAQLQQDLPRFCSHGFSAFQSRWEAHDLCRGRALWLVRGDSRRSVVGCGVDESGGLRVAVGDKQEVVFGGEVSIRWR